MALATVVAGPYTCTYNSSSVGQQEDGFRLRWQFSQQNITSNTYGDSVIDAVLRGANVFLQFTGIEYASAAPLMWPVGTLGLMGLVGRMVEGSTLSKATVLTAVSGTTAASSPATLTASKTFLSENSQNDIQFASRARYVPIELRLYPYDTASSAFGWFTTT